jgi:hypothetical protein
MGKIVECHCTKCGYSKKNLFLGSGMIQGYSYFPALDSKHKSVVQIDTNHFVDLVDSKEFVIDLAELEKLKEQGKIPYFVKGMFKKKRLFKEESISDAPLHLQSKHNLCPKCGKFSLSFEFVGLFD